MVSKRAQRYFPLIPHKHMHAFIMLSSFHQCVYSLFVQSFVGRGGRAVLLFYCFQIVGHRMEWVNLFGRMAGALLGVIV